VQPVPVERIGRSIATGTIIEVAEAPLCTPGELVHVIPYCTIHNHPLRLDLLQSLQVLATRGRSLSCTSPGETKPRRHPDLTSLFSNEFC